MLPASTCSAASPACDCSWAGQCNQRGATTANATHCNVTLRMVACVHSLPSIAAAGAGAHGHFTVTNPEIARYCKASVFKAGKKTPITARFSSVTMERGAADTARDPRGFALKFRTDDGNWDLVANNVPVFFM